jgi:hypothetical protein
VFERWLCSQVHWGERLRRSNVVLLQLVAAIQEHDLTKSIHGLQRLWLDTGDIELELKQKRVQILGNRSGSKVVLNVSAHIERLTHSVRLDDHLLDYLILDKLSDLSPLFRKPVATLVLG